MRTFHQKKVSICLGGRSIGKQSLTHHFTGENLIYIRLSKQKKSEHSTRTDIILSHSSGTIVRASIVYHAIKKRIYDFTDDSRTFFVLIFFRLQRQLQWPTALIVLV